MSHMFSGCAGLKELNLSNFNTDNVQDMCGMFSNCSSLENLNISNFNSHRAINMEEIFSGCWLNVLICSDKKILSQSFD